MMVLRAALLRADRPAARLPGLVELHARAVPHAARLAADDVSVPRRPRARAGVPPRVGSARAQRGAARDASGRGAAAGAAAPAASALPLQHAEHDLRADSHRRRRRRHDDRPARRSAADDAAHSITQEVPLKDELDVLQKYLEIEQTRFGNRLRVNMHIQPETLDAQVPNLLLQPLVENAIRHGIAPNARPGWIEIHAERDRRAPDDADSGQRRRPAARSADGAQSRRRAREHARAARAPVPVGVSVHVLEPRPRLLRHRAHSVPGRAIADEPIRAGAA